jgi:hypothetical protein
LRIQAFQKYLVKNITSKALPLQEMPGGKYLDLGLMYVVKFSLLLKYISSL